MDVGEPEVAALELIGQPGVIDAEAVEQGGLDVVDMNGVFDDVVAVVVGFTNDCTGLYAAPGHPHREAAGMMIATVIGISKPTLAVYGAAKFATPDDKRVFEQAALFEIENKGG